MANKNKDKVIQMLSPENYIRKKARSLPIHECWITENWEESGMASIIVSRQHTNGNITFCFYLVDLLCLGVKDSAYKFNVTDTEFRNFLERNNERMEMELIDYVLAHNIILSAVEFAEEYGFKPHKDFTSVTEFMLEEDNDDIELMEIECGRNGKPLYVQGPYESEATANKILKQLEKTVGTGNYDFIREGDELEDDWEDEDDDQFKELTLDEKGEKFMQYVNRLGKLKEHEYDDYLELLQSIVDDLMDIELYNRFYDELTDELNSIRIEYDKIPNALLGINDVNLQIAEDVKQTFLSIISNGQLKQKKKQFKTFSKNNGFDAAKDYIDVLIHLLERSKKYESKLKSTVEKHPDYAVLQLKWAKYEITQNEMPESLPYYPFKLENFFKGREYIHAWEYFCYLDLYTHFIIAEKNFAKLDALKTVIRELDIIEDEKAVFNAIISTVQTGLVASYFKDENNPDSN